MEKMTKENKFISLVIYLHNNEEEIIPFLEDLIPGVSVTLIVSVVRIVFVAAVSLFLVFTFSTVGWRLFLRQRARHYLKNMPVFSEIDSEFAEEENEQSTCYN